MHLQARAHASAPITIFLYVHTNIEHPSTRTQQLSFFSSYCSLNMMNEVEIAEAIANQLHRLSNWNIYLTNYQSNEHPIFNLAEKPEEEEEEEEELEVILYRHLNSMKRELALHKAIATGRDLKTVAIEVELEVMRHLGMFLAKMEEVDPLTTALRDVVVMKDEEEVCGVCHEEMWCGERVKSMGCVHKFHGACIERWVKKKNACPLCRYELQINLS